MDESAQTDWHQQQQLEAELRQSEELLQQRQMALGEVPRPPLDARSDSEEEEEESESSGCSQGQKAVRKAATANDDASFLEQGLGLGIGSIKGEGCSNADWIDIDTPGDDVEEMLLEGLQQFYTRARLCTMVHHNESNLANTVADVSCV